jgi:hypothetical protein
VKYSFYSTTTNLNSTLFKLAVGSSLPPLAFSNQPFPIDYKGQYHQNCQQKAWMTDGGMSGC